MKNLWTKKNPFMSVTLSAANAMADRARGFASATAKRNAGRTASAATTTSVRQVSEFRAQALKSPTVCNTTATWQATLIFRH